MEISIPINDEALGMDVADRLKIEETTALADSLADEHFGEISSGAPCKVVLDLNGMPENGILSSSLVGVLIGLRRRLIDRVGEESCTVSIAGVPQPVMDKINMMNLNKLFTITARQVRDGECSSC